MSNQNNLPEAYTRLYNNLKPNRLALYNSLVADIESNHEFMSYASNWNKRDMDAYHHEMYETVNYKMCLLRDARRLEWLDAFSCGRKQVILDVGCGAGYFSYFAAKRGHTVYSMEATPPIGIDLFFGGQKALGLSMIYHTITPFQPLPDLPQPCTLAVFFSPVFFWPSATKDFWREPEWRFFLKDLANRMDPDGTIYFHMNSYAPREDFEPPFGAAETRELFLSLGSVEKYICTVNVSAAQKLD